jgi:hypothetical protein
VAEQWSFSCSPLPQLLPLNYLLKGATLVARPCPPLPPPLSSARHTH